MSDKVHWFQSPSVSLLSLRRPSDSTAPERRQEQTTSQKHVGSPRGGRALNCSDEEAPLTGLVLLTFHPHFVLIQRFSDSFIRFHPPLLLVFLRSSEASTDSVPREVRSLDGRQRRDRECVETFLSCIRPAFVLGSDGEREAASAPSALSRTPPCGQRR